jgi:hypothetical protein
VVPSSFAGSARKDDGTRMCFGIKKAKLELKQQKQDVDMKQTLTGVKDEVNALNETHKEMLNMMKTSVKKQDDMEILKLLKIKYKAIRSIDKVQANALKVKIAEKSDDILKYYIADNNLNAHDKENTIIQTIETPLATKYGENMINSIAINIESCAVTDENRDPNVLIDNVFNTTELIGTKKRLLDLSSYHNVVE